MPLRNDPQTLRLRPPRQATGTRPSLRLPAPNVHVLEQPGRRPRPVRDRRRQQEVPQERRARQSQLRQHRRPATWGSHGDGVQLREHGVRAVVAAVREREAGGAEGGGVVHQVRACAG